MIIKKSVLQDCSYAESATRRIGHGKPVASKRNDRELDSLNDFNY